jgi:DNA invertase Pin-like site-specific DNA recombinase
MGLESQAEFNLAYAAQMNWSVVRVVSEDYSGFYYYERPLFGEIRKELREGKADILLCHSVDRLTREQSHALDIYRDDILKNDCELWFVKHGKIENNAIGKFILSTYAMSAEKEREDIVDRTWRGKRARLMSGKVPNYGCNPYGYRRDKEKGVRIIHDGEAEIVRLIFDLYVNKEMSLWRIGQMLNDGGIASPASAHNRKFKKDNYTPVWNRTQIRRVLSRPEYKGEAAAFRYKQVQVNGRRRLIERDASEVIKLPPETTPAIVSVELWEAAQEKIDRNRRGEAAARTRNRRYAHLLRGMVFCAMCGGACYPVRGGGKSIQYRYRCGTNYKPKASLQCEAKTASLRELDAYVWGKVVETMKRPDIVQHELKRAVKEQKDSHLLEDLENLEREIVNNERGQARLIDQLATVSDNLVEMIQQKLYELDKQRKRMILDRDALRERLQKQVLRHSTLKTLADYCRRVSDVIEDFSFEEKREMLEGLDVRVLANGDYFEVVYGIPLEESQGVVDIVQLQHCSGLELFLRRASLCTAA